MPTPFFTWQSVCVEPDDQSTSAGASAVVMHVTQRLYSVSLSFPCFLATVLRPMRGDAAQSGEGVEGERLSRLRTASCTYPAR